MKLNLPLLLHAAHKNKVISHVRDPKLPAMLTRLVAVMEKEDCQKFIFDSGEDGTGETNKAVLETAAAMIEMGRFHLPYPAIWIEDPFTDNRDHRLHILAMEQPDAIHIVAFFPMAASSPDSPLFCFDCNSALISLVPDVPDSMHNNLLAYNFPDQNMVDQITHLLGNMMYTVKKLVVSLAARGTEVERKPSARSEYRRSLPHKRRKYPYTLVRVPTDFSCGPSAGGTGTRPRKVLVRGYIWGKNTRPEPEQRLIDAYWRGSDDPELPPAERDHYEVRVASSAKPSSSLNSSG